MRPTGSAPIDSLTPSASSRCAAIKGCIYHARTASLIIGIIVNIAYAYILALALESTQSRRTGPSSSQVRASSSSLTSMIHIFTEMIAYTLFRMHGCSCIHVLDNDPA
jgi:CBS domain containing-hemolysin-like protein